MDKDGVHQPKIDMEENVAQHDNINQVACGNTEGVELVLESQEMDLYFNLEKWGQASLGEPLETKD